MPPRMRKRPKSRIHDTGKGTARQILAIAREMRDDPDTLVPECAGECQRCPVEPLRAKLRKISSMAGDARALDWATRWGGDLERAYAGIVLLAEAEDIQAVANLCLGGKVVSYAVRGHPPAITIAGLQNWDDPEVRLLAYRKTARKLGTCLYSTDDGIYCTGPEQRPPKEFLEQAAEIAGYDGLECAHKSPSLVGMRMTFNNGLSFEACETCASEKGSFATAYISRSYERKPLDQAVLEFRLEPECDGSCGECPSDIAAPVNPRTAKLYLARALTDKRLIAGAREAIVARMEPGAIVAGGRCLGKGPARLVAALSAEGLERKALEVALEGLDRPILVDAMTTNKVLSAVWGGRGRAVLEAVAGKEGARLFNQADDQPMGSVKQAATMAKRASMNAALPSYRSLGPIGSLADAIARAHKEGGQAAACELMDRQKTLGHRENSVALAFYTAMGQESTRMWKYGKDEGELGASLAPLAKAMLDSTGAAYDGALRQLLRMSGSGEEPS